MAQNDIHKLVIESQKGVTSMFNTMWFREEIAGVAPDQRATLANDFVGTWITPTVNSFRTAVTQDTVVTAVTVQRYVPYEEGVFRLAVTANNAGTITGTVLPSICAVCITLLTAMGGRRGRGRFYLPPPQAVSHTDGNWSTTHQTAINNSMTTLSNRYLQFSGYSVSGFRLGVWSRVIAGPSPPYNGAGFTPGNGWVVRPEVRAIRRRARNNL